MRLANGSIAFTNLSATYAAKATQVLDALSAHPSITQFLAGRKCDIVLEERTIGAPADIVDNRAAGVIVTMAAYYFEDYDLGYVVGMFCHEFAIHHLADARPLVAQDDANYRGVPFPVPGLTVKSVNSADAVQEDHAFGVIPATLRHTVYREVTLEMAELLRKAANANVQGARFQDVTDLLDCFLMDAASIAATNDHRLLGVPARIGSKQVREDIAAAYRGYKALLRADPQAQAFVPYFPPDKTADAVGQGYLSLMGSVVKGVFSAPSISDK